MSEIVTNKITPSTGSSDTVTLGDSGDTFNIPSGATITNSGTATGFLQAVGSSGNVLTSDGTNWASTAPAGGGGAWEFVSNTAVSSQTSVTISGMDSTYDYYEIHCGDLRATTNGSLQFMIRTSTNNGTSFDSGGSDYTHAAFGISSSGSIYYSGSQANDKINMMPFEAGWFYSKSNDYIIWKVYRPNNSSTGPGIGWEAHYCNSNPRAFYAAGYGHRDAAYACTAIQIYNTRNSDSFTGNFRLYGLKQS